MGVGGELRMIEQAVKQKWNIPIEVFTELPQSLFNSSKDTKLSQRDRNTASKILVMMNEANKEKEHQPRQPQLHIHADVTGKPNGDFEQRKLALIEKLDSLIRGEGRGQAERSGIVPGQPPSATSGQQAGAAPQIPTGKQRKAKSAGPRNRRNPSGK